MNPIKFIFTIKCLFIIWIVLIVILYIRADKEYEISYKDKYYKKLPGNYTPAEMKILINYKRLYPRDTVATLANLIVKGYISVEKIHNTDTALNSKKDDYLLKINPKKDISFLQPHEITLANWFVGKIGNGREFKISDIKNHTRKNSSALLFNENYINWCRTAIEDCKRNNFFITKSLTNTLGIILSITYLILSVSLALTYSRYAYLVLIIPSLITFIYTLNIIKRTPYGQEQYALSMAFKRYIKDIGKNSELSCTLSEGEKYLPYAISLAVAEPLLNYLETLTEKDENLSLFNKISVSEFKSLLQKTNRTFETSVQATKKINKKDKWD